MSDPGGLKDVLELYLQPGTRESRLLASKKLVVWRNLVLGRPWFLSHVTFGV